MCIARIRYWLGAAVAYLFFATLAFYEFIASGGDKIAGNFGDNRLYIYLLEHWYRVFGGHETWNSPRFYAPVRETLAYSDTVFLNAIPYSVFRAFGLDRYLSFEWSLIVYNLIGYGGMLALLRRHLGVGRAMAIGGALLFTFSSCNHLWILSAQTYSVMLLPVLILLLLTSIDRLDDGWRRAAVPASSFAILLGLLLFSTYYIAWFFMLFSLIAGVIYLSPRFRLPVDWRGWMRRAGGVAAITVVPFAIALAPFVYLYGPLVLSGRRREFSEVLTDMLPYQALFNVGSGNVVWGQQFELNKSAVFTYGIPPVLLATFTALTLLAAFRVASMRDRIDRSERVQLACGIAVGIVLALMFKHNEVSLWVAVWLAAPGAKAIRVLPRFLLVLNLFMVLVVVFGLQKYWERVKAASLPKSRALHGCLIAGLGFVLLVEQLNTAQVHDISRKSEQARLDRVGPPPAGCRTAFLAVSESTPQHPIGLQLDMMLVAQKYGLATVNGYSGFAPGGWLLDIPKGPEYFRRVEKWLVAGGLESGACVADLESGVWKRAYSAGSAPAGVRADQVFFFAEPMVKINSQMSRPFDSLSAPDRFYTVVGAKSGATIRSTGKSGYLQYGPYLPAEKGSYVARWHGTVQACRGSQLGYVEAVADNHTVARQEIPCPPHPVVDGQLAELRFRLENDAKELQYSFLVVQSELSIQRILVQSAGQ